MCYFLVAQWILIEKVSKRKKIFIILFKLSNLKLFGRDKLAEKQTAGLLFFFFLMCS